MKKIVAFALMGILIVSMSGCRHSSKLSSLVEKSATETADSGIDTSESVETETDRANMEESNNEEAAETTDEESSEEINTDDVTDQADDDGTFDIQVTIPDNIRSQLSGDETFIISYESDDFDGEVRTGTLSVNALEYENAQTVTMEEGFYFVTEITCLNDTNSVIYDAGYSCSDLFVSSNDEIDRTALNIAIGWEAMKAIIDEEGASVAVNYNPPEMPTGPYIIG